MSIAPSLKKPKIEHVHLDDSGSSDGNGVGVSRSEQEEALVAIYEHRSKEVEHLRRRVSYYQSELGKAENLLGDAECKLARFRSQDKAVPSSQNSKVVNIKSESKPINLDPVGRNIKSESKPINLDPVCRNIKSESKPINLDPVCRRKELLIPAVNSTAPHSKKSALSGLDSSGSYTQCDVSGAIVGNTYDKSKNTPCKISPGKAEVDLPKKAKPKLEQNEHKDLTPLVRRNEYPSMVQCYTSSHIASQHKRKLRSIILSPQHDPLFVTSALDGVVNLWQLQQPKGTSATLLSSTDCLSPRQRRWPEDIAWHPLGQRLVSVYSADGGDSQISVIDLNKTRENARVTFLEAKPHIKGIINSVVFVPWEGGTFVTGGSDHAVIYWSEVDEKSWKPKSLHRNNHSSAVMGVAGSYLKPTVLSGGADKRIIGFDVRSERAEFKYQIDSKCMSVLPNPRDFNLLMAQTGTHHKQLRLFDMRLRQTEIHVFGWKQENSESQSALINQAWSPDGLYITSGSADPVIHIFDIRYNAREPSQSIKGHQKRVFKAVWHYSIPVLVSISSDLNIGLHTVR